MESDQLKLLGRSVAPIDMAIADVGASGLRVFIQNAKAVETVSNVLDAAQEAARNAGRGPVQFCLMDPTLPGEVDMELGQDYAINPQIKGAIKSLEGVLTVEDL